MLLDCPSGNSLTHLVNFGSCLEHPGRPGSSFTAALQPWLYLCQGQLICPIANIAGAMVRKLDGTEALLSLRGDLTKSNQAGQRNLAGGELAVQVLLPEEHGRKNDYARKFLALLASLAEGLVVVEVWSQRVYCNLEVHDFVPRKDTGPLGCLILPRR